MNEVAVKPSGRGYWIVMYGDKLVSCDTYREAVEEVKEIYKNKESE